MLKKLIRKRGWKYWIIIKRYFLEWVLSHKWLMDKTMSCQKDNTIKTFRIWKVMRSLLLNCLLWVRKTSKNTKQKIWPQINGESPPKVIISITYPRSNLKTIGPRALKTNQIWQKTLTNFEKLENKEKMFIIKKNQ